MSFNNHGRRLISDLNTYECDFSDSDSNSDEVLLDYGKKN